MLSPLWLYNIFSCTRNYNQVYCTTYCLELKTMYKDKEIKTQTERSKLAWHSSVPHKALTAHIEQQWWPFGGPDVL